MTLAVTPAVILFCGVLNISVGYKLFMYFCLFPFHIVLVSVKETAQNTVIGLHAKMFSPVGLLSFFNWTF